MSVKSGSFSIVIVNWNSGDYLKKCLRSIRGLGDERSLIDQILIVDNASKDASLDCVRDFRLPIGIDKNACNEGFAYACNQGASRAKGEYLLFLNPDTELEQGTLTRVGEEFVARAAAPPAVIGVRLRNARGETARTCARFPTPGRTLASCCGMDRLLPSVFAPHFMIEWDHLESREVDQVIGAFFCVRRDVFDELGGFDERFFVYYEELDFCYRAAGAGRRALYLGDACAKHAERGSSRNVVGIALFYAQRSRLMYLRKHFSRLGYLCSVVGVAVIEPMARLLPALLRADGQRVSQTLQAYWLLWRWLVTGLPSRGVNP